jgi:phosphatidylserine/phosphatidylglycerophosphate/cardiolipin synthase-like enzyme
MLCECRMLTGPDWWRELSGRIAYAHTSIKVSMFLFSPTWTDAKLDMVRAFSKPAEAGLQCRILLSANPLRVGKRRPNLDTARKLLSAGWDVRVVAGRQTLHEKLIVIDDTATFIGSHNLSYNSATTNLDLSVLLEGKEAADAASALFWNRWKLGKPPEQAGWEMLRPITLPFQP